MVKKSFVFVGTFIALIMSFMMVSAAYTTTDNNVTLTIYNNSVSNASTGDTYVFDATITNLNASDYYVVFGTTDWTWVGDEVNVTSGTAAQNFTGVLSIPASHPSSKSVIAKFYESTNESNLIFQLSKSISISYATTNTSGCTDSSATNYDPSATTDDGSCTYSISSSCSSGEVGDLEIVEVNFNNNGEGEDDEWFLLDEIEIEVEVENTHNSENVKDVMVEIRILDSGNNDVTSDFEFDDEEIDLNTIRDDDSEYATFKIDEVPADLDSGDYKVYIKAYSENDEDTQCASKSDDLSEDYYQKIDVTREDDPAVIIKGDDFEKVSASCGDKNIELPLSVYNLGTDKEKKVLVMLSNRELNVNEQIVIDNLRSGKKKDILFYFDVPEGLSKDSYVLEIITYYDFDDDEDDDNPSSYSENSDDDLGKVFQRKLEVLSCSGIEPTINANLMSESKIGEELVIKSLITNNGEDGDFLFSVSGYESWADLIDVSLQSSSIKKGEYVEVVIKLKPKESGINSFSINAIVDGETHSQPVSVNVEGEKNIFPEISNTILYIIIAIVVILILIFLVLIARLSRRNTKPQF